MGSGRYRVSAMKVGDIVKPRHHGFEKSIGVIKEITETSIIVVWSDRPNSTTSYNKQSDWLEVINA